MPGSEIEAPSQSMTFWDYMIALFLAISSRNPLANLRVVVGHMWEDFGPSAWFTPELEEPYVTPATKVNVKPGTILYAHRWGVWVAYLPEALADLEGEFLMMPPRRGMALFAEHGSHVPRKTGTRRDLDELARLTGRRLDLVPDSCFFIPFTSTSTDPDLDLANYGDLILTMDEAKVQWFFPTLPREAAES